MAVPSTPSRDKLTDYLMGIDGEGFKNATQAKFLEKAGGGTLAKSALQQWLSQDRLYAQAYVRFASLLLANIPLPSSVSPEDTNEQLADLIVDSLANVRRELKFFEDVAGRYGLDIDARGGVSEGVKRYRDLFFSTGEGIEEGKLLLVDGLVLLWGTEKCYLEAWRYAATFAEEGKGGQEDIDGGALRKEFIPNWTSEEFVAFVEKIGHFADLLWEKEGGEGKEEIRERVEKLWRRVLDVEVVFWPTV